MNTVDKNRIFLQRSCNESIGIDVAESDWLGMKMKVEYKEHCLIQMLPYCLLLHIQEGLNGLQKRHWRRQYKHTSSADTTIIARTYLAHSYNLHMTYRVMPQSSSVRVWCDSSKYSLKPRKIIQKPLP